MLIVVAIWTHVATRTIVTVTEVRIVPGHYERSKIRKFRFLINLNLFTDI
jgi:hypothetical protein